MDYLFYLYNMLNQWSTNHTIFIAMNTALQAFEKGDLQLSVSIQFYCPIDRGLYDLGFLTLKKGDRSLYLDCAMSYYDTERYCIDVELEFDEDEIASCFETKHDLTITDLYDLDEATFYIGCEYEVEPESITLFVKQNGSTRAIDLIED